MEVLSSMLKVGMDNMLFLPHSRCKRLDLFHVSFADDIFIFVHGETQSIKEVLGIVNQFSEYTGLIINKDKTSMILGSVA